MKKKTTKYIRSLCPRISLLAALASTCLEVVGDESSYSLTRRGCQLIELHIVSSLVIIINERTSASDIAPIGRWGCVGGVNYTMQPYSNVYTQYAVERCVPSPFTYLGLRRLFIIIRFCSLLPRTRLLFARAYTIRTHALIV